jgi:predicted CXXCH cytochrome family protein
MVVLATAGAAFANFGPHGGYALDTDACAGCHRAHTSFSNVTWTNAAGDQQSALLVSSASTMQEFCYACHGADAPGASTNVQDGVFDSGPSGDASVVTTGGSTLYLTNSTFNAPLNGGLFTGATSMHDMEGGAVTDPMWGAGSSAPTGAGLNCSSCHDVHGSSNYRLLKDSLTPTGGSANTVGGYDAGDNPQAYVFSSETGYPIADSGWKKHQDGANQMALYRPNYTTPQYYASMANSYPGGGKKLSMSTWCSGCHEQYDQSVSAYNYGAFESNGTFSRTPTLTVSGATASVGSRTRHRHPVDVPVATANTINGFGTNAVTSTVLPLEKIPGNMGDAPGNWQINDQLGCLTCHYAHGTNKTMTGWANARIVNHPSSVVTWSVEPTTALVGGQAGVNPNISSALLRANNRGVCERCHNK